MIPSAMLLHAAWIMAAVVVYLALCASHSRKSSSSTRPGSARSCCTATSRTSEVNGGGGANGVAAGATPTSASKVSPTPSDTAKSCCVNVGDLHEPARAGDDFSAVAGPVTVIDVGTHGPISPAFPVPETMPPRRSLSVKHIQFAELLERIRSRRYDDAEGQLDDTTLWTKTILLWERCRIPSGGDDAMVYRPRHPLSVPVTRSNSLSLAGVLDNSGGSCRPAAARL